MIKDIYKIIGMCILVTFHFYFYSMLEGINLSLKWATLLSVIGCFVVVLCYAIKYKRKKKFKINLENNKITFDTTLKELLELELDLKELYYNDVISKYMLNTNVFNFDNKVELMFEDGKLIKITINIDHIKELHDINKNYDIYNNSIKKIYGKPDQQSISDKLYDIETVWEFKDALMRHYIYEKVDGAKEKIVIKPSKYEWLK